VKGTTAAYSSGEVTLIVIFPYSI